MEVTIIGAGLAGAEAALQLAKRGIKVDLYEMRPEISTGAHKTADFAEFVCSNSLGSFDITNASGLLKKEMELLGGELIKIAYECQVPAGSALAVDRELFSRTVTRRIEAEPNINIIRAEAVQIPQTPAIIASGPLTSEALAADLKNFTGCEHLYFFDAVAPIVEKDSINFDIAFYASRYDKGEAAYINCPMNKEQYEKFYNILINAQRVLDSADAAAGASEANAFADAAAGVSKANAFADAAAGVSKANAFAGVKHFEGCLPVEVLASRGVDTLRYGPLKPVGLIDKRAAGGNAVSPPVAGVKNVLPCSARESVPSRAAPAAGTENYAVVQLRQDNSAKTLYNLVGFQTNLKWGAQKELLRAIPGLENVNIVRYGVMHRNTFINSPKILEPSLQTRRRKDLFFAGQITGTEGYTESIATGLLAGLNMARRLAGEPPVSLPRETMLGALTHYISDENHSKFQPINSNWGILPPLSKTEIPPKERKNKKLKSEILAKRAIICYNVLRETYIN